MTGEQATRTLGHRLLPSGLDLVAPVQVGLYNGAVPADFRLPDFGRPDRLAVVVGNTRALWPPFLRAFQGSETLQRSADPVEDYVAGALSRALEGLPEPWELRHAWEEPPRRVAMQRLAAAAGLAWTSPAHLSVHPVYGPWIALRSVVVFDLPGPPEAPAAAPACPHCQTGCEPALRRALEAGWREEDRATWRDWLAVRDACPRGREHRYSEDQIRYHYAKDRGVLPGAD